MSELRDFSEFYARWKLPEAGIAVAEAARKLPPTRDVFAGSVSVSGITTMRHNGTSIPFESRTPEYFFYTYLNISDDCLEVRPQPPARKIAYQNADGRRVATWRTHDALCFWQRGPTYVECKNEKQLLELESKAPDLFTRDDSGRWISPACARDAESLGFGFEVFCPDRYDVTFVRNADFLFNYLWRAPSEEYVEDIERVCAHVHTEKLVRLDCLLEMFPADAIYFAAAGGRIHFDWYNSLLRSPAATTIYASALYQSVTAERPGHKAPAGIEPITIAVGSSIDWDKESWRVVHIAADKASLVNEQSRLVTIAIEDVLRLASRGEMRIVGEPIDRQGDLATQLLKGTSYESLEAALARYEAFCAWERGDPSDLSDRTARDWRQKIRAAEATYGWPALGLIHRNAAKGNRTPKADPRSVELAKTRDLDGYETPAAGTVYAAYGRYKNRCKKEHLQPVSLTKYQEIVKERKGEKQDAARFGHRYATQRKGPETDTDLTTPPNGDRVWEVAHIDHTPVDVETVSILDDEPLGTPWLSYMIDAFTRMILAMWLSFFRPSRIAVMMIMRDCVRRHNRLPDKIVVDRGAEFSSVYFDTLIAKANLKKFCRPKGEPRYGAVCERVFGTTNTRNIHEVIGNTKARRHGRGLSGTHDPKKHMIWTPDGLYDQLEDWSFETYPRLTNRNTTEAPRARMDRSLLSTGQRLFTAIPYNENFWFATMPEFPHQSTRTVRKGVVQIDKMDFRGRHESLVCFNGEEGPGRWEPMWPSTAFIELRGHSYELTCSSDLARELMENLSRASHMEVSARMRNGMRKYREVEPTLLDFLQRTASRQTEQANRWQAPVNEPVYPENEPSSARTGELRAPRDLAVSSIGEP